MKKVRPYIIIFLIFFIGTILFKKMKIQYNKSKSTPLTNIKIKNNIIDLGDFLNSDTLIKRDFIIYNLGPNNLYIYNVKPDCKCTGVLKTEKNKPIAVYDSSIVTLSYKPQSIGAFQVSVSIDANTESLPFLILRGNIIDSANKQ